MNITEISEWLETYYIENYTINEDLSVDVNGNVFLSKKGLTSIPVNFRNVSGYFSCYDNNLPSLENCPQVVGTNFYCENNNLPSLENCPQVVGGSFSCYNNKLTSLEHCPQVVGRDFYCSYNNLTSLEHCPQVVGGNFYCPNNKITSLEHCPQVVGGVFHVCDGTIQCSDNVSRWLISRNKDGVNLINNPSDNMLILHKMLWAI